MINTKSSFIALLFVLNFQQAWAQVVNSPESRTIYHSLVQGQEITIIKEKDSHNEIDSLQIGSEVLTSQDFYLRSYKSNTFDVLEMQFLALKKPVAGIETVLVLSNRYPGIADAKNKILINLSEREVSQLYNKYNKLINLSARTVDPVSKKIGEGTPLQMTYVGGNQPSEPEAEFDFLNLVQTAVNYRGKEINISFLFSVNGGEIKIGPASVTTGKGMKTEKVDEGSTALITSLRKGRINLVHGNFIDFEYTDKEFRVSYNGIKSDSAGVVPVKMRKADFDYLGHAIFPLTCKDVFHAK
jgi:hypothetical protein